MSTPSRTHATSASPHRSPLVGLVLVLLSAACSDGTGGAGPGGGGPGGDGGTGVGGSTAASGGSGGEGATTGTGGSGSDDAERARIAAERATLDACGLPDPCDELHQNLNNDVPLESMVCPWEALALEGASGRFTWRSTPDGCFDPPCEDLFSLLYVDGGQAMLSWPRGPLLRCTLRDPAFFQACSDALAVGETVPQDCRFFDGWVEDCVDEAEPACF